MSYVGIPPFGQTVRTITEKIAIAGQVDFYPDGGYLPGYIDIELNGQGLLSTDVIATDGVKVTLLVACSALDEFKSVAYWPVSLVDTYRKSEAVGQDSPTGAARMPVGTTAQRPDVPVAGMYRLNTTTSEPEWYDSVGGRWVQFADHRIKYDIEVLVVAGGGGTSGGSSEPAGGGGAGGLIANQFSVEIGTTFSAVVGAGGAGVVGNIPSSNGANSSFFRSGVADIVVLGGGRGGNGNTGAGVSGGSGGGSSGWAGPAGAPGTVGQGNAGGNGGNWLAAGGYASGGGGGKGAAGIAAASNKGGNGGDGVVWPAGSSTYYAGGGAGGVLGSGVTGTGGAGGGGNGCASTLNASGSNGTANTGGGGGAANGVSGVGGSGGSGTIVIRYAGAQRGTGGTVTSSGGYTYHTFTSSGTFTA